MSSDACPGPLGGAAPRSSSGAHDGPTRWLDADEQRAWRSYMYSWMLLGDRLDRELTREAGISHAVSRLEERGWVRRQVCAEDGRGQLAVLTDAGFAALEAAAPVHVGSVRTHLFDQLSPAQVTAMRDIGETLLKHLADAG